MSVRSGRLGIFLATLKKKLINVSPGSQPSIRGILLACSVVAAMIGFLIVYAMGTVTTWRNAALVCLAVPSFAALAICFVRIRTNPLSEHIYYWFSDTRNTVLAPVQKPQSRGPKIPAMASRLGLTGSRCQ